MSSCKISAQNTVQPPINTTAAALTASFTVLATPVSELRPVSELSSVSERSAVSALRSISALLIAPACVLRLTAETCAIVIVAKQAVVFNMINAPKPQKSSGTKIP